LESELFGHEKGAFTGADRKRIGKFEQCNGGTLFLDEIGDMTPTLQAKLLRVLQEQRFERLGSNEMIQTQVRVLAATNQDLPRLIEEGRFRKDLYYRLNVVTIKVPPLRERLDDVAELAHYFLFRFDRELGLDFRAFAPEALQALEGYSWPGNVRELQSVIKQALLQGSGHLVLAEFLPDVVRYPDAGGPAAGKAAAHDGRSLDLTDLIERLLLTGEKNLYDQVIAAVERLLFTRVLTHTHGHQVQASELLGLNRQTLRNKLRTLGLAVDKILTDEAAPPAEPPRPRSGG
jgi:two-component system nitrogen regulation response regulator GlnG